MGRNLSPPGSPHRSFPKGLQAKVTSIFSPPQLHTPDSPSASHQVHRSFSAHGACTYQRCPPDGTMTFQSFSFSTSVMNLHEVHYWDSQRKVGFHVIFIIYPHSWQFLFSLPEAWKRHIFFYQCPSGHTLICQHSSESKRSKLGAPLTHPSSTPMSPTTHPPPIHHPIRHPSIPTLFFIKDSGMSLFAS